MTMINKIILFFLLTTGVANAYTERLMVCSRGANECIVTEKILHIIGDITFSTELSNVLEFLMTEDLPGDRLVIIDSSGGEVDSGTAILRRMQKEQARGIRQICVVMNEAASMAANILSYCDVRLSYMGAEIMFHAVYQPRSFKLNTYTAEDLSKELMADELPFIKQNSKALGMTRNAYKKMRGKTYQPGCEVLLQRKYLHGYVDFFRDFSYNLDEPITKKEKEETNNGT